MTMMDIFCPPQDKKFVHMTAELAELVARGATIFKDFIDAYEELSDQEKGQRVADIKEIEHRCDELSHLIMLRMQSARIMHKHALLNTAAMLGVIMDGISSASKRMILFRVSQTNSEIQQFAVLMNNSCKELVCVLHQTQKKQEARKTIVRIHGIEREADYVYNLALAELFISKKDAKEIIILKDLYDLLESTIDNAEYASRYIENMI